MRLSRLESLIKLKSTKHLFNKDGYRKMWESASGFLPFAEWPYELVLSPNGNLLIFKTCKTLSNCDAAINGIILGDKILISSLIAVSVLNLNTRRIEQKLVSKIDTYKI